MTFKDLARSFAWAAVIMAPFLGIGGNSVYAVYTRERDAKAAQARLVNAYDKLAKAPAAATLPVADATHGRELFMSTCIACHGPEGKGIAGLGKDLTKSDFVAAQSDAELHKFIVDGRPAARPVPMPPRAGRPELTDKDLSDIVVYLRGLQDPRRMPELPKFEIAKAPSADEKAKALAAAGGDAELAEYIASGNKLFHSACVACHGAGGVGIKGNGKALVKNDFVKSLDDDKLAAFIKQGRAPTDPKNTTGIQMPPKGGNPALSDDDILDIVSYLRTLQGSEQSSSTK